MASFETDLYRRLHEHLGSVRMVDTHQHLQQLDQLPPPEDLCIGRLFDLLTASDLVSAGMSRADLTRATSPASGLSPRERWALLEPWYRLTRNTTYFEWMRLSVRELYGVDDFTADTVETITEGMRALIRPGVTRQVFDRAGIDFAMNNPFGYELVFRPTPEADCFLIDMHDQFTDFLLEPMAQATGIELRGLDDYLQGIDLFFDRYASISGAFKVGRAYDRILSWDDVPRAEADRLFARLLASGDGLDPRERKALEDFVLHYLCGKCGEHHLRMKFHCGHQEGTGNLVTNARVSLLTNLFLQYPGTDFDIYHISYPYWRELLSIAKTFPNVTANFCFAFVLDPHGAREALASMLDAVPASKLHGYGGDHLIIEAAYGAAVITRREVARVLAAKVEDGRFTEEQAAEIGAMLLRDNALRNFNLAPKREAYRRWVEDHYGPAAKPASL